MPYIPPEVVARAREVDLLTYLRNYEPQELVHFGGGTYCTREHDSLKISNGKWCWFSRGIGGYSALDYLIKVKEMPFTQAAETIMGKLSATPPAFSPAPKVPKEKVLLLPQANRSATHAVEYLHRRGIDYELIDFCIHFGNAAAENLDGFARVPSAQQYGNIPERNAHAAQKKDLFDTAHRVFVIDAIGVALDASAVDQPHFFVIAQCPCGN